MMNHIEPSAQIMDFNASIPSNQYISNESSSSHEFATSSITNSNGNIPRDEDTNIESLQREIENLDEEQKRSIIIGKLYKMIESAQPLLVAKITGMIIHKQSTDKLIQLIISSNHKVLHNKINEATKILTTSMLTGGEYYSLYHDISRCNNSKEKILYLRSKLYPKVEEYVFQKNLAHIITEMLLQLDISELFVLLNEKQTLKGRMDEAIKAYLEHNKINTNNNSNINS